MKNLLTFFTLTVAIGLFGTLEASAQRAKDLYTQYDETSITGGGAEGAKVSVRLKRGNQPERIVSVKETFYSGDKIKLVFDINFSGYVAILNIGTTGSKNLLFPYLDTNRRMVSHRITPNAGTQLPRGNAWINFDSNSGQEQVMVMFSKKSIFEEQAVGNNSVGGNSSSGGIASQSEREAILAELNSKNLITRKSKDLYTQTESDGTYVVAQNGLGDDPVVFSFYLKHK